MSGSTYALPLSFEQVVQLVQQLPLAEKRQLSAVLAQETLDSKLGELLDAFRTDELSEDDIRQEAEAVRAARYARSKAA